ncbi:very short patch repair endonuclease [Croceibacterium sp. TMG7-5b_MA50]|uniref:very short patch repair endonuclease n=1 Tax=Croceibacterium sp. TMG7-5b_MA50 TaxID=3121290 RepID=UPI003222128F
MVDTRSPEQRSRIMQSVKTAHTGPEMTARRLLHSMGYRYRLHPKELPGKPDIVFRGRKAAIFVHGCFWHGHECQKGNAPKSRLDYWGPKLAANRARDCMQVEKLEAMGWRVLTIWQCEIKDEDELRGRLHDFLGPPNFRSTAKLESVSLSDTARKAQRGNT